MHGVVVARAAKVGQAAGERQTPWVVGLQTQQVDGSEHGDRKAAVNVDVANLVDAGLRCRQGQCVGLFHGARAAQVLAVQHHALVHRAVAVQVNPFRFRNPQRARRAHGGQQQGRALVDLVARHHADGVRVGNHAVVGTDLSNGLGRPRFETRRMRIVCCDRRKRRHQLTHGPCIGRARQTQTTAPRMFKQRVNGGRKEQAVLVHVPGAQRANVAAPVLQVARNRFVPIQFFARCFGCAGGADGFAAAQQHELEFTCRQTLAGFTHQTLRFVAAGG